MNSKNLLKSLRSIFSIISRNIKIDTINDKLSRLESNLDKKFSNSEFFEFKENYNLTLNQITFLKDNLTQLLEDRHIMDDFIFIKKKVDNLASALMGLKTDESNQTMKLMAIELNRYVELSLFSEFQKNVNHELEKLKESTNDNKKQIVDILKEIKLFIKEKDLKLLEGII